MVLAPIVRGRKGEYGKQLEELRAEGFTRVKVDGELRLLEEEIVLDKKYKHDISVVVDRLVMRPELRKRLADSVETAVALADGIVEIETVPRDGEPDESTTYSRALRLPALRHLDAGARAADRSRSTRRTAPARAAPGWARRWRSTPSWWCRTRRCRSARARSCRGRAGATSYYEQITQAIAERYEIDLDAPWEDLPEEQQDLFLLRHQRRPALRLLPQPDGAQALVHDDASRASSPTSSAATRRPTPTGRARRSRSTCRCGRARSARARGCGRSRGRCTVGGHADPRVHGAERASARSSGSRRSSCPTRTARSRG